MLKLGTNTSLPVSSYALILANAIPLLGVLFFAWDSTTVLALYWLENLIIGAFNVLKMAMASLVSRLKGGVFIILFFCVHYGLFCAAHGALLVDLIGFSQQLEATAKPALSLPGPFVMFSEALHIVMAFMEHLAPAILLGVCVILLSRIVSFIEHFILRGELYKLTPNQMMMEPYGQIIVMHVGLVLGAIILRHFNNPVWLLAIIVIAKIVVDHSQHVRRHRKKQQQANVQDQIKDL